MLIGFFATGFIGLVIGIIYERYRWVRAQKNDKVIEVDGDLYTVHKIRPKVDK